ncbi:MAG: hypothetical protein P1U85_03830 [Verrucomicrobiales bacterium]|nr:hypothetical protein [Verrucomicrobiales bacterium]
MKHFSVSSFFLVLLATSPPGLHAQNGLRDIPDTSFEAQLEAFALPSGAEINLFAHEPAVKNPVHMNWDQKGRLWVVSSPLYPHIQPGEEDNDRIIILEDTDSDGVADKHTVFADDLHIPTAILPGDGGCYVANSIEVLFLKDTDGDDIADERSVVLSGFGTEDTHHLVHTFRWGPEGMLWMNQSIYIHTHLETPYGIRRLLGGGMWHYRPETRRAEVFMKGLINPWGHAFDQWGQSFMTDGAGGEGINFVFPRAVFRTSPGASRVLSGLNPGQPKHCGLEVLSGGHIPDEWSGVLAAPDFRGNRINLFRLTDNASAYTSSQIEDLVSSKHRAFRPIDIKMGPDGAIYIADWYNPIIQHGEVDFRDPRRDKEHGRIWRITFPDRPLDVAPEIDVASDEELVDLLLNSEQGWNRELATVELRERDPAAMLPLLASAKAKEIDPELFALRQVWGSQALNSPDLERAAKLVSAENHKVRAGALRALYYSAESNDAALGLAQSAIADPNPQVRLWAVSVLAQRPEKNTVDIALQALEGIEVDNFLDFAIWSICREHADRWVSRTEGGNPFQNLRQLLFAVRALNQPVAVPLITEALRSGEFTSPDEIANVSDWIAKVGSPQALGTVFDSALQEDTGVKAQAILLDALASAGRLRKIQPQGDTTRLSQFLQSDDPTVFASAAALAGQWKLDSARGGLERAFLAAPENPNRARSALDGLVVLGGPKTAELLGKVARDEKADFLTRSLAVIGRTRMNPNEGAKLAVAVLSAAPYGKDPYGIFDAFLANKKGPGALTAALSEGSLPKEIALTGMNKASSAATRPEALVKALQKAGNLKPMKMALTPEEMESMMAKVAEEGDPHRGEEIYRRASLQCVVCHAIGGAGGVIGPDMVSIGASAPVDYLIDSLLQPSVKIKEGYHTTLVTLKNGDSFAGAIAREDANEIVIRDAAGTENRIPKSEVVSNNISPVSLMPPGLTASLREDEFVDLVRFLSELGKDGDFKTPPNRFVRQWQTLMPHERTRDAIGHQGPVIFTEAIDSYVWMPIYSEVGGGVPTGETPDVVGRGSNRYAVLRTFVDAPDKGPLRMKLTGKLKDLTLFHGENKVALPETGDEIEILIPIDTPGRQKLTLVGLKKWGLDRVSLELLDDAGKSQLVELKDF